MVKRVFDFVAALSALLLFLPVLIIVALVIAGQRDGPVFFCQRRIGRFKEPFLLFKFRTMKHRNSAEVDQLTEMAPVEGRDKRITRVGRFLRASSLDEIPQLVNVLNGTMSLVGPRPMIPEQLLAIPVGLDRGFSVLPGITGWAQVNGRRGVDWLRRLEMDAWYADNCSVRLDVRILFLTVRAVFSGTGTYGSETNNWRSYLPK